MLTTILYVTGIFVKIRIKTHMEVGDLNYAIVCYDSMDYCRSVCWVPFFDWPFQRCSKIDLLHSC